MSSSRPTTFRSASTDCWHENDDKQTDHNLTSRIDTPKKFMRYQSVEKMNDGMNSAPQLVKSHSNFAENLESYSNRVEPSNRDKFKSKSYLLSINRSVNNSQYFNQSLDKNSARSFIKKSNNSIANCNATISGTITSKASKSKSSQINSQISNLPSATTSCINTHKKKRSSLFNLFSFSNRSTNNSSNNIANITSGPPDSPIDYKDFSTPDFFANDEYSVNNFNELSEDFNQPLPEYVSQWSSSNSTSTADMIDIESRSPRPHSVAFYTDNSKHSPSPVKKNLKNSKLSLDIEEIKEEPKAPRLRKNNSTRSKGFSVPLNASFCLNPVPINCIHSFSTNSNPKIPLIPGDHSPTNRFYKTASSIRSTANTSILSLNNNENYLFKKTNKTSFDDEDANLFKPGNSFNMEEEGSCLKELYQKLKIADDVQNSENSKNKDSLNSNIEFDKKNSLKRLVKQTNVDYDADSTLENENQISNLNENIYESLNLNTKEDQFFCSSTSASPSASSTSSSTVSNNNDLTKILQKSSNMFHTFTSSRINNHNKYDVEGTAKCLNERNHYSKRSENDLAHKEFQFKYLLTNQNSTTESNEIRSDSNGSKSIQHQQSENLKDAENTQEYNVVNNSIRNSDYINKTITDPSICLVLQTSTNSSNEIMLQPKKGVKLRDLLRPIFTMNNLDIEKCSIYKDDGNLLEVEQNIMATTSLVDLNELSENYSGAKLVPIQTQKGKNSLFENKAASNETSTSSLLKLRKKSFQGTRSESYNHNDCNDENLLNPSTSSNNWQNYFNSKINTTKEKSNSKQKRNSCIAYMNDVSAINQNPTNTMSSPPVTTLTPSQAGMNNLSLRDSVSSFQSYLQPNGTQGSSSPCDRSQRTSTKNFRKMTQLTSIFVNYNKGKDHSKAMFEKILEDFLIELPKLPSELSVQNFDPTLFDFEYDWNKFVGESFSQSLSKNQAKQQMTIWELLSTEASHIKTTKVIIDVFLSCLVNLKCNEHTAELFKDIEINKLFSNIIEVYNCNLNFWQTYLYPIIKNLHESEDKLIDPSCFVEGFSNFKTLFSPYEEFILEKTNSLENLKKHTEENEFFSKFITWAENNPLVGRLKIADFMMIPVQRLTKYELLLKKIHQFTEEESKRTEISYIIDCVYSLPNTINIKLKYLAQFNKISDSIEKYEGIVGPTDEINEILSTYKILDIKSPLPGCLSTSNRELIHQGPLKLKDTPKSFDVHCFLFTDLLLITQLKKSKKYKIIRPPVLTNKIIVRELFQTDKAFVVVSLNDYKVPESVCMFISNQSKKWIEFLEIAQKKYLDEIEKARIYNKELNNKSLAFLNKHSNLTVEKKLDRSASEPKIINEETVKKRLESTESTGEIDEITRRDSSTTITAAESDNNSKESTNKESEEKFESEKVTNNEEKPEQDTLTNSNSFKSIKSGQSARQYQQQHNGRFNSRIIDRRIQRRNMTDPLSTATQINSIIDEKHSVIMNSIIKRNSLNDKSKEIPKPVPQLTSNLYGDSTSTILSTDSGVSSTSCENNHTYSNESISKTPAVYIDQNNIIKTIDNKQPTEDSNDLSKKRSTLKPTNSVLSTTSSTFSSSSSSHEPNMSYSSSFNSTSSSSRFASKSNSLNKKHLNENTLNEMENESRVSMDDYVHNNNDTHLLSGEDEYEEYYDLEDPNISHILGDPEAQLKEIDDHSSFTNNTYNEIYPSRRLFSTVKIKNKSQSMDANSQSYRPKNNNINPQINFQNSLSPNSRYDINNNETLSEELSSQYFELINRSLDSNHVVDKSRLSANIENYSTSKQQSKFQQPNFSLNTSLPVQKVQKKPLVKINSQVITNDMVRVNTNEVILKSAQHPNQYDMSIRSGQNNSMDPHQRMTLVKLLHTTMDATEV